MGPPPTRTGLFFSKAAWRAEAYSDMFWNAQCGSPKWCSGNFPSSFHRLGFCEDLPSPFGWASARRTNSLSTLRHTDDRAVLGPVHLRPLLPAISGWEAVYPPLLWVRTESEAALQRGFSPRGTGPGLRPAATVGLGDLRTSFCFSHSFGE